MKLHSYANNSIDCGRFLPDVLLVSIRKLRMRNYWFSIRKRGFFVLARKSRGCAEAYIGTPHK